MAFDALLENYPEWRGKVGVYGCLQRRVSLCVYVCDSVLCVMPHVPSPLPFPPILTTQPPRLQVVMFVIIRDRTRGFIEDRSLGRTVDGLVGRVNGRYGHTDYCPVKYVKGHLTVRPRRGCSWLCQGRGRSMYVKGHRGVVGCVEVVVDRLVDVLCPLWGRRRGRWIYMHTHNHNGSAD